MKGNREKLEDNALNAVQIGGLKSLSFRTMAKEIGIKSSSVHYHFPDKSDLARALIERYSEEFFHALKDIGNKRWKLRRKIKAFIEIFESVAEQKKLCLCGMLAAELEQLDQSNRALLAEYFIGTEKWITNLLDEHRDEVKTDISSTVLARSMLSGLEGALLLDRVLDEKQRLKAQKELFMSFFS
jgi:TetR/AcrR family transcriptional repressor of nem operon